MAHNQASAQVTGPNQATITLPPGLVGGFNISTHSSYYQFVTLEINGNLKTYSGRGEFGQIGHDQIKGSERPIVVTFEFSTEGKEGPRKPSKIRVENTNGPSSSFRMKFLRILAEDGVDTDYDDAVFVLQWGKPRGDDERGGW